VQRGQSGPAGEVGRFFRRRAAGALLPGGRDRSGEGEDGGEEESQGREGPSGAARGAARLRVPEPQNPVAVSVEDGFA
jgi:hypothetical protein